MGIFTKANRQQELPICLSKCVHLTSLRHKGLRSKQPYDGQGVHNLKHLLMEYLGNTILLKDLTWLYLNTLANKIQAIPEKTKLLRAHLQNSLHPTKHSGQRGMILPFLFNPPLLPNRPPPGFLRGTSMSGQHFKVLEKQGKYLKHVRLLTLKRLNHPLWIKFWPMIFIQKQVIWQNLGHFLCVVFQKNCFEVFNLSIYWNGLSLYGNDAIL